MFVDQIARTHTHLTAFALYLATTQLHPTIYSASLTITQLNDIKHYAIADLTAALDELRQLDTTKLNSDLQTHRR